ncbi:hypothetical protein ACFQW6_19705 [Nocardioides sp. GCM10028917]|uniref:hypothetical protein n=1 Tax=Nocardioides sp. GCM10028917 TaxID=3273408 RepID=UPI00361CB4AF
MWYLIEFVVQVVAWAFLAMAVGSLFLLVTQGTANVFASYCSASTVAVVSALVVWLTRRSLLKREHRRD